ncbi:MAG: methyltransferase domain-containing protein [Oligoflexia bacterium]|nr:methyltransferase domain-containing protein [Oligoflexia bacterium]
MLEMNYGCGTTVHLGDLRDDQTILYVGVGGGLEALQFAWFARRPGGVIAVDPVAQMREKAAENFAIAAQANPWFDPSFVSIIDGSALALPIDDQSVDIAAQNCLFNIFTGDHRRLALREISRVLRPHGRLILSDPISPIPMPEHLAQDQVLRARCLSGAPTYDQYMADLVAAGFGTIEVRRRMPYRLLDARRYELDANLMLESVEVVAIKDPVPADGACIFTGRTAFYIGDDEFFDDGKGHHMLKDLPLAICDKTAAALSALGRSDIVVTDSTWHYAGGGCC